MTAGQQLYRMDDTTARDAVTEPRSRWTTATRSSRLSMTKSRS
ncbi:MAG: hypothetical protein V8S11_14415 [Flavonifractor plautii]